METKSDFPEIGKDGHGRLIHSNLHLKIYCFQNVECPIKEPFLFK